MAHAHFAGQAVGIGVGENFEGGGAASQPNLSATACAGSVLLSRGRSAGILLASPAGTLPTRIAKRANEKLATSMATAVSVIAPLRCRHRAAATALVA